MPAVADLTLLVIGVVSENRFVAIGGLPQAGRSRYVVNLMEGLASLLRSDRRSQAGQGIIEYGLILVLVAVAIIAILLPLGGATKNLFSNVVVALST